MTGHILTITPDGMITPARYNPADPDQIANLIGTDVTHHSGHPRGIEEIEIITDNMGHLHDRNSAPNPVATLYSGHPVTGRAVIAAYNPDTAENTGMSREVLAAVGREIEALIDLHAHTGPGATCTGCTSCYT